jgi:hypothetical protein
MGIKAPDAEKVQIYVLQMYASEMFTEIEMTDWEDKAEATKIWTEAKKYFGALYKKRRSYESDMKAHRAGFESANSIGELTRITSATSIGGTTQASRGSRTLKSPTNEWVEYSDGLEDSLTEAKEYAAAITSKMEAENAALLEELKQQRQQTQQAIDQTARLVAMMESAKVDGVEKQTSRKTAPAKTGRRDPEKDGRLCKNCKEMGFHEDEDCFHLDKNKDKRPTWWKKKYGKE